MSSHKLMAAQRAVRTGCCATFPLTVAGASRLPPRFHPLRIAAADWVCHFATKEVVKIASVSNHQSNGSDEVCVCAALLMKLLWWLAQKDVKICYLAPIQRQRESESLLL